MKSADTYVFLDLHRSDKVTQDTAAVDVYNLSTADNGTAVLLEQAQTGEPPKSQC